MKDPQAQLLDRVERYLIRSGTYATDFGRAISNNPALVGRLRRGSVTGKTMKAVSDYLAQHLPKPKRKAAK